MRLDRSHRDGGSEPASGVSPSRGHAVALIVFAGVFGALLLPKILPAEPGLVLSNSPADGAIFLWALGWWPHAIAHGILMPYTHALFAPEGTNLAWTTSIPVPGLLMAPITKLFGVFAAFNVLSLLAPVSAAWITYLLAYRVTRNRWASLASGLIIGLSPLEMVEVGIGHLDLTLVALVPLALYLVVRYLEGSLGSTAFVLSLGVVLAAQAGVSTEILLTATLFGGVLLLALYAFDPRRRVALRRCAALVALGYLVAGVLASPLFYAAIWLPHPSGLVSAGGSPAPLSGVRTVIGAGGGSERAVVPVPPSAGISRVDVALLAIPLIAILVYLAWTKRAEPVARALTVTALIVLICSAGVVVIGSTSLPTPWALVQHLPLFGLVRPQRLTLFFWLIAAIGVGAWLAERPRSLIRWGIASAVVVSMLPPIWTGAWTSVIPTPPSLATAGLRQIALGDNLLVVAGPGGAISHRLDDLALPTVWQVRSNFSFRLADAYVGSFPPDLPPVVQRLVFRQEIDPSAAPALLAWLRRAGVTWVMVMRPTHAIEGRLRSVLRSEPIRIDGLDLYAVPAGTR